MIIMEIVTVLFLSDTEICEHAGAWRSLEMAGDGWS